MEINIVIRKIILLLRQFLRNEPYVLDIGIGFKIGGRAMAGD